MLVNNISDFNKDLGFRKSYPHVVGFYNAILSIKVYEIIVVILFLISYLIGEFSMQLISLDRPMNIPITEAGLDCPASN